MGNDSKSKLAVKFIVEEPAQKDEFGSHDRVARALCAVLRSSASTKSIGLLGEWGSGKSTVIDFARKHLKQAETISRFEFFIYDAWRFQNDPIRLSLLSELQSFLSSIGLKNTEEAADIEYLSGSKSSTDNKTTSTLSPLSILFAFVITLVPAGLVLMRSTDSLTIIGHQLFLVRTVGNIFLLSPVLLFISLFVVSRPNFRFWTKAFWVQYNKRVNLSGLAGLLINKSPDSYVIDTKKTPEPTAKQFHDAFQRLIALARNEKIIVTIVIDNLDRVDSEHAMAMWSEMRSFFDNIDKEEENEYYNLRLILPIDRNSLNRVYTKTGVDANLAEEMSQAFLQKTFDVLLQVGPPVASDWENYLNDRLQTAMIGGCNPSAKFSAYRVFSSIYDPDGLGIGVTPRKLNSYVNRIAALYIQWKEEVNFASLAYYAAISHTSRFEIRNILGVGTPAASLMDELHDAWRRDVAVLHYGVSETKALQVLVGPELDVWFKGQTDGTAFSDLAKIPGFQTALRTFLEAKLGLDQPPPEPAYLLNAAAGISQLTSPLGLKGLWQPVRTAISRMGGWGELVINSDAGIAPLFEVEKSASVAFVKSLQSIEDGSPLGRPQTWLFHASAILEAASDARAWASLAVPGSAEQFLDIVVAQEALSPPRSRTQLSRSLRPVIDRGAVEASLTQSITDRGDGAAIRDRVRAVSKVDGDWRWTEIVSALDHRFRSTPDPLKELSTAETMLALYRASDPSLVLMRREGFTADLFAKAHAAGNVRGMAVALAMISEAAGDISHDSAYGDSAIGQELLDNLDESIKPYFADIVSEYVKLCGHNNATGEYLEADAVVFLGRISRSNHKWQTFAASVLTRLVGGEGIWKRGYGRALFSEADKFLDLISGPAFASLMAKGYNLVGFEKSTAELTESAFWSIAHERMADSDFQAWVNTKAKSRLNSIERNKWQSWFDSNAKLVGRIVRTKAKVSQSDFGEGFADMVTEWWARFLSDGSTQFRPDTIVSMFKRLKKSKRTVLLKDGLDKLLAFDPREWEVDFVRRIIPPLLEFDILSENSDRIVRSVILAGLTSANIPVKRHLMAASAALSGLVQNADVSTKEELADRLDRLKSEPALAYWSGFAKEQWISTDIVAVAERASEE